MSEPSDEREALITEWSNVHQGPDAHAVLLEMMPIGDQMSLALRDALQEVADLHHTVQGEPNPDREAQGMSEAEDYARDTEPSKRAETVDDFMTGWRTADRTRVQGEPSDAMVLAALNEYEAWSAEESLDMWGSDQAERMRRALHAAAVQEGKS